MARSNPVKKRSKKQKLPACKRAKKNDAVLVETSKTLLRELRVLARTRGQQPATSQGEILIAMRVLDKFLFASGATDQMSAPFDYIREAFEHLHEKRPHPLFDLRVLVGKSPYATRLWDQRLWIVALLDVISNTPVESTDHVTGPKSRPSEAALEKVYSALKPEILALKTSQSRASKLPRKKRPSDDYRVLLDWLKELRGLRKNGNPLSKARQELLAKYRAIVDIDGRFYSKLDAIDRKKWFDDQVAEIQDRMARFPNPRR